MRSPVRLLLALGCSLTALAAGATARADPSAWMAFGGGAVGWKQSDKNNPASGALSWDIGVGTSPNNPVIVGGLFRLAPILGHGSDLVLQARIASHGYQAGGFGLALDLGGYERFWGAKSAGFAGGFTLGVPLGFQVALQTTAGSDSAVGFGVIAGIDFLRLTVYRQTLLDWWPNPSAAQRRSASGLGSLFRF